MQGDFSRLPGFRGWVFLAFRAPPDDLALVGRAPVTDWLRVPGPVLDQQLAECGDWTAATGSEIRCGTVSRVTILRRVAVVTDRALAFVDVRAGLPPLGERLVTDRDVDYVERLTTDLVRRLPIG